jgi:pimeloyl-ACP methyl ester carboxylesterase
LPFADAARPFAGIEEPRRRGRSMLVPPMNTSVSNHLAVLVAITCVACVACGAAPIADPAPSTAPAAPAPTLHVEPYRFTARDGTTVDAELGTFEVPERRANPRSRRIALSFVRFRSTAATPGSPIVYLAGGPGVSGINAAAGARFPIFMALRKLGDVIAFDQRGTGRSNHLKPCDGDAKLLERALTRESFIEYFRRGLVACFAQWEAQGSDIDGYTTRESADDLEDLRRAIGARTLNLWGISYGSHLGLAMLKYHERSVGRAVFAAIEGLDQTVKRPALTDEVLERAQRLLARDPVAAQYPDFIGTMRRVHARLETDPVAVSFTSKGGAPVSLRLGGFAVQRLAGGMIADPQWLAHLPRFYRALDEGAYEIPAQVIHERLPLNFTGMSEAMDIASGITAERLARVTAEARTSVLGDALNFPMPHLVGIRPELDLGDAFRAPLDAATPVLFISGTLDGRTCVPEAAAELRGLRNGQHLIVENGGHNIFEADPRIGDAVVAYFAGSPVPARIELAPPRFLPW